MLQAEALATLPQPQPYTNIIHIGEIQFTNSLLAGKYFFMSCHITAPIFSVLSNFLYFHIIIRSVMHFEFIFLYFVVVVRDIVL